MDLKMDIRKPVQLLTAMAGTMDTITGLLLVARPAQALALMGIEETFPDLILIRFIGAFVFAVGSAYLIGLRATFSGNGWRELRFVWKFTGWVRVVICAFTSTAIYMGSLSAGWLGVPLADGILAFIQFAWILSGNFPADE